MKPRTFFIVFMIGWISLVMSVYSCTSNMVQADTWKITKQHALTLGFMPALGNNTYSFATLQYRLTL